MTTPTDRGAIEKQVATAERYFRSFADDYHRAFEGTGKRPLHRLLNRLFRRETFQRRTHLVEQVLREHGIAGKTVLDLGCGSGEVSLIAARLGAQVTGLDIVDEMVQISRAEAAKAGLAGRTTFRTANIVSDPVPTADVTLMIAVIEYYSDLDVLFSRVCAATRELLIVVDTRGPLWRRLLRYVLARLKRFYVFYRSPDHVAGIVRRQGFVEQKRVLGHSFTVFVFQRT